MGSGGGNRQTDYAFPALGKGQTQLGLMRKRLKIKMAFMQQINVATVFPPSAYLQGKS
jgi:hypothetical protein